MQVVADCNVAVGRGVATRREREDEASTGVSGGGYRRRGVGGNESGRDRNQTSRHRVEGVDGEGSTPVRATIPVRSCMGSYGVAGRRAKRTRRRGHAVRQKGTADELKRKEELKDETEKDGA